ncbi:MAG: YqhA family protein [Ilumatobacteraceae bacterium]
MSPTDAHDPIHPPSPGERAVERALWGSRFLMLVGVAGSIVMAVIVLWLSVVDLAVLTADAVSYASAADRADQRADLIGGVVKTIDSFLLAAILVLVAFGLYELFVSRLEPARDRAANPRILLVISVDELKDRIAKLVVLILVIEFFQKSLEADLSQADDLLELAGAISLVAIALTVPSLVGNPSRGSRNQDETNGPES